MFAHLKHLTLAVICVVGIAAGTGSVHGQTPTRDPSEVLAKATTFSVTRSELDVAFARHEKELLSTGRMVHDGEREKIQGAILERLVFLKLLMSKATPEDKAKGLTNALKAIEEVRSRAGTPSGFKRLIERAGMDEASFTALKTEEQTVLIVMDRLLKSTIQISDDAVAKYYNDEKSKFEKPETIRFAHILVATRDPLTGKELGAEKKAEKRKKVEEILARLRKGEDFAKLARENSDDAASRANGGELTITRGQTVLELEAAAAALKPREMSGIVTTAFGFHILRGIERKPATHLSLADTTKDIREFLTQKEFEKQIPDFTEKLRKEAGLEMALGAPKSN